MDIQSFLRLKSLFGSGAQMAQPGLDTYSNSYAPPPEIDNTSPDSTNQNLLNQYNPRHAITDQYTSTLANMPARPEPSRLRQLGASIAGLGAGSSAEGIAGGQPIGFKYNPDMADKASDKFNYPDYDNQLNDWMLKTNALGKGATEEDRANTGEVKRLAGDADREIKQQAVDIQQQKIDIAWQKEVDIFNTKATQQQAQVAHWAAEEQKWLAQLNVNRDNNEIRRNYEDARNKAANARTEMMGLVADHRLAEAKMQNAKANAELILRREQANKTTSITQTVDSEGHVTGRETVSKPNAQYLTDPKTRIKYDTTGWSAQDILNARARGYY